MVHFEDLSPEDQVKFGDKDRFLAFDSVRELDMVAKAAAARTKWRQARLLDPFSMDINLAGAPADYPEGFVANVEAVDATAEMLDFFADMSHEHSRHWHPVRQETDRQRARNLAAEILDQSRLFDAHKL